jgi:small subunit ribosomal protein S18
MIDSTSQETRPARSAPKGRIFFKRIKQCPFAGSTEPIDYKDIKLLKRFISVRGKIIARRLSGVSLKRQRELAVAIKRARFVGLLPFVD